jgi:arsenate reductase
MPEQDMTAQHEAYFRGMDLHRLVREFEGVLSRETVERVVDTSMDELESSSRLTNFLPLLGERFARERLRAAVAALG